MIATGSRPIEIPGFKFDGNRIVDSTGALDFATVPERFVVIGGGYIGIEIGTLYAKLGSKVTVVEALPAILPGNDPEIVQLVARKLKKLGVEVVTGAKAKSWAEKSGRAEVTVDVGGKDQTIEADKVLVAVGRRPNSEGLGLEEIGVKIERGLRPRRPPAAHQCPRHLRHRRRRGAADARAQGVARGRGGGRGDRRAQGGDGRSRDPGGHLQRSGGRLRPASAPTRRPRSGRNRQGRASSPSRRSVAPSPTPTPTVS